jgi:type IV pilus assembly protein PilV
MRRLMRGFSLIESLVALAVLSVGLLGAAGMLLTSLADESRALRHQQALQGVLDIAERIRANPAGAAYAAVPTGPAAACEEASPCDGDGLAARDVAQFHSTAQRLLPHQRPLPVIHFEPATGPATQDRYVISLRWTSPGNAAGESEATDEITLLLLAQPVAGAA